MVLQVAPHRRAVVYGLDAQGLQPRAITDAGELKQLRGVDGATAEDHLTAGRDRVLDATAQVTDPARALAFEGETRRQRLRAHLEVTATAGLAQMLVGARGAEPRTGVDLVDTDALALRAIEIGGRLETERLAGRDVAVTDRVDITRDIGDMDRATATVVARVAVVVVFSALEERQYIFVAPADVSHRAPVVEVMRQTAHVDHGIDRTGAAEHLAARPETATAGEPRIGLGLVQPVDASVEEQARITDRQLDHRSQVAAAGLQHQHAGIARHRKTTGQHAARRAATHDHIVEGLCIHGTPRGGERGGQTPAGCWVISRCSLSPR